MKRATAGQAPATDESDQCQRIRALATALFWVQPRFTKWALAEVPRLAASGQLSLQQLTVLHLVRTEGLTLAQLARRLMVAPTVVTGVVDRIENQGLIRRLPDPNDRRSHRLVLTAKGEAMEAECERGAIAQVERRLDSFTAQELATLAESIALLDRLTQALVASQPRRKAG